MFPSHGTFPTASYLEGGSSDVVGIASAAVLLVHYAYNGAGWWIPARKGSSAPGSAAVATGA